MSFRVPALCAVPSGAAKIPMLSSRAANVWLAVLVAVFGLWSAEIILSMSVLAPDGHRYFTLFDDAMISMRYAWNLTQGHGLVWNTGERVEGYTDPLWVAIMAGCMIVLGHDWAPLAVSCIGAALVIATAFVIGRVTESLLASQPEARLAGLLAAVLVLLYYPLLFWSLCGLEVSLLAFLVACQAWLLTREMGGDRRRVLLYASVALALLAYAARPDGLINVLALAGALIYRRIRRRDPGIWRDLMAGAAIVAVPAALHMAWRHAYYRAWLPNTYVLKVAGYAPAWRLSNGLHFIVPFLGQTAPLVAVAVLGALTQAGRRPMCLWLLSPLATAIAYQVYVGGDAFPLWRQLAPSMILVLALAGIALVRSFAIRPRVLAGASVATVLCAIALVDWRYASELILAKRPFLATQARELTLEGLALRASLHPNARILAFWAGNLPYYWRGPADDALGKTDATIASQLPHHEPRWLGMTGVPGHSKYDLARSIEGRSPDIIQRWIYADQDMSAYVQQNYVRIRAQGFDFCARRASAGVDWLLTPDAGPCVAGSP
jgi:arabinofuranosyltransferase